MGMHVWFFRIATFCVLAGRAYQHLFWDGPYRSLVWDEGIWGVLWEVSTGLDWHVFVTHPYTDLTIVFVTKLIGVIFGVGALLALHSKALKFPRLWWGQTLLLAFMFFLSMKTKQWMLAQFIEHAAQMLSPVLLLLALQKKINDVKGLTIFACSLTFLGHGLYAFGLYPVPGDFVDMVLNVFGGSETQALRLLKLMGGIDIICGLLIWVPFGRGTVLSFMVPWGLVTSLARFSGHYYGELSIDFFHAWGYQVMYRLPHFILPLYLILGQKAKFEEMQQKALYE
jgi:hypothetical protein